jgi:hypothetical protein
MVRFEGLRGMWGGEAFGNPDCGDGRGDAAATKLLWVPGFCRRMSPPEPTQKQAEREFR